MTIMRHEDLVAPVSTEDQFSTTYTHRPTKRYLMAAGFRITILFLTLCILVAISI